jgi:XRE family transcriptional regulator, fatty acid utilization regulator
MSDRADDDRRGLAALGTAIRTLRAQADLTVGDLGERAQIEPAVLSAVEDGRREPTWGDLRRIARGLETPLEELLELAETLEKG